MLRSRRMTVGPCVRAHQSAIDVPGLGDDAEACSYSRGRGKSLRTIAWSSTSKIRIAIGGPELVASATVTRNLLPPPHRRA